MLIASAIRVPSHMLEEGVQQRIQMETDAKKRRNCRKTLTPLKKNFAHKN
jgi:hypothetical protein